MTEQIDPTIPTASRLSRWLERALAFNQRYPWLLPLLSFAAGWLSFALVQRGEHLSRLIAALTLLGWIALLAEDFLGNWVARVTRGRLSENLVHFATQSLQIEILFFALPFLIAATHDDAGQIIFTGAAIIAAVGCTVDPLYTSRIAGTAARSVAFHAFCSFLAGLVVLPIALQLPLEKAVPLSLALTAVLTLLCVPRLFRGASRLRGCLRISVLLAVLAVVWFARSHIPPAGLVVKQSVITATVSDDLQPGAELKTISAADLANGIDAFVSVHAPLGLAQSVRFEWIHESELLDNIPATIKGGRAEGFRTYSRKQNFPLESRGRWTVNLRTPDGQLIARMNFRVS
ncbi:DUF5924 family protein [Stenotrophobium rhamnosiphilum]|uniref:DUF5924 family protein n=1 Tax=Stenotrophobium rhamnosiphilum TaxID=2029166 RepID=UPI001374EA53|nr:DUF2914 domain-containing protein [Stenotrophobium rhamnosiphilum]